MTSSSTTRHSLTDFMNFKIKSIQSFRDAHRGRICERRVRLHCGTLFGRGARVVGQWTDKWECELAFNSFVCSSLYTFLSFPMCLQVGPFD
jgi:hypothetical protein